MKNDKIIVAKENSLFNRIKKFLSGLFNKTKKDKETIMEDGEQNIENTFLNDIKVNKNVSENVELLSLKEKYDNGIINEDELTDEQVKDLINLYNYQIEEYKVELNKYNKV